MGCKGFFCGMGLGLVAGAAAGMMIMKKKQPSGVVGKLAKLVAGVADELSGLMS